MPDTTLASNSLVVGDDIRRVEHSIQTAMRDTAQLVSSIIETVQAGEVCANACHAALTPVARTFQALLESHKLATHQAHRSLELVGRKLGLDEASWGGSVPKHGFSQQEEAETAVDA